MSIKCFIVHQWYKNIFLFRIYFNTLTYTHSCSCNIYIWLSVVGVVGKIIFKTSLHQIKTVVGVVGRWLLTPKKKNGSN